MLLYPGVCVFWQSPSASAGLESPASPIVDPPILVDYPPLPFFGVTATGPGHQHGKQHAVELRERLAAGVDGKVIAPAYDNRSKQCNQEFLIDSSVPTQSFVELVDVPLYCWFAGFDVGSEAEQDSTNSPLLGAPGLPGWMLPDVESQKVKAWFLFSRFQGVDDPGLARFRFQSHLLEPLRGEPLAFFDYRFVFVEDDEIIGVPDHSRFSIRERSAVIDQVFLHSMQRDVAQQRRDASSLRGSCFGRE
jgi:hypothetical protein